MFGLQNHFDQIIKEQFKPYKLGVKVLESEFEKIGLFITDEQRLNLEEQFKNLEFGTLSFDFNDKQLLEVEVSSEEELKPKLQKILNNLPGSIEEFLGKIDGVIEGLVLSVVEKMAKSVNTTFQSRLGDMLEDQNAIYVGTEESIHCTWGKALDLLQGLIVISDEAAQGYLTRSDEYSENDLVQDVLLRIHAKANQIAKEILTLIRHGFADGAQARWRSLHELAVVSNFIADHGEDVAEKYIQHESIDIYKSAVQYNEYYTRLGAERITDAEMMAVEQKYIELIKKYGKNYGYEYGWAADAINMKKPSFRDIETAVELDHIRPYYKAASANIHANPAGVFTRLGLFPDQNILLAGPSNIGFSDPAQSTAISLTQITTAVLTYNSNIDFLVVCKAMAEFSKDVENEFMNIENAILKQRNT
ncbi:hypothetical protein A1353_21870 [Methylomonas methanica]|uniref:Uncharacterized protein n=1 Tax=Methylomonas methanica TaxID=421 RepID=A0A177M0K1_METMH|nr:DUF5677 domain-containing protein [Methylomonas methanica]OAH98874.1 hypothetical protein A1353_21870 [Methylomonas methanica]